MANNKMREIEIEKAVLNCGGTEDKLERSVKLLEMITGKKVCVIKSTRRIPAFGISPKKKSGAKVTLRNRQEIKSLLNKLFSSLDKPLPKKQITNNHLSFGIHEYIEVPGLEYNREIGMLGFEITVVFSRKGKRVKMRKIKKGKYPLRQEVTRQEIIEYLNKNFKVKIGS